MWDLKITTPRNHNGHMVIDADATDETIVEAFTSFIKQMRAADVETLAGTPGVPPAVQLSKRP